MQTFSRSQPPQKEGPAAEKYHVRRALDNAAAPVRFQELFGKTFYVKG